MMSTHGSGTGNNLRLVKSSASAELTSLMVRDALTITTATTAESDILQLSLTQATWSLVTRLEHAIGLLKQCNRDIKGRLNVKDD